MRKTLMALICFMTIPCLAIAMDVTFQWGASTGQVDGYRIYHGDTAGGPYPTMLCQADGESMLTTNAELEDSTEYYLVCRAFNEYGESDDSNEIHWLRAIPGPPESFGWWKTILSYLHDAGATNVKMVLSFPLDN